jgi:UDP-glucose 4-epimerase
MNGLTSGRHALVTGAAGFIGRHLTHALQRQGFIVTGIGHGQYPESERQHNGLQAWLNGEISSTNLELFCDSHGRPDFIFHLAGGSAVGTSFASPLEDFSRSVETASRLAEWTRLRSPQTRLIMASSAAVYGASHSSPISVDATPTPYSPYGYHKRMAELVLESYSNNFGLKTGVVRFFSVYGPQLKKQLLWDCCNKLATGTKTLQLGGTGDEVRDWIQVQDAVQILIDLALNAHAGFEIRNGGTGTGTAVRQIATQLIDCWSGPGSVTLSFNGQGRPGDPFYLVSQSSPHKQSSGQVADWRAGLQAYVAWFKSQQ